MKKHLIHSCLGILVFSSSCGSSSSNSLSPEVVPVNPVTSKQEEPVFSSLAATKNDLPECNTLRRMALGYATQEKKAYVCNGTAWDEIILNGKDGKDGTNAAATKVVKTVYCSADLNTLNGIDYSAHSVFYRLAYLSSGDLFVNAVVYGPLSQSSGSLFYAAGQNGSASGGVTLTSDVYGTNNYGWWYFKIDTNGEYSVEYNDTNIPGGKATWTFANSACSTLNF